jgi:hypothetical protein
MAKKGIAGSLLFLLLALAGTAAGMAQSFSVGKYTSLGATGFDPGSKTIYAVWADSIGVYTGPDYTQSRLIPIKRPEPEFPIAYEALYADSSLYFVHRMGGLVYRLEGDSIRRVDNSFNHRMQINSTIFTRNDTIMRYGGYGFWSHRNFFTYFTEASREWEVVSPSGSTVVPTGTQNAQIVQDDRYIYIYSGTALDPIDPLKVWGLREAWRFDAGERRWEFLGNLDKDFHTFIRFAHMGDRILYGEPTSLDLVLVDPANNSKTYYERLPRFKNVLGRIDKHPFQSYYADGTFFLLRRRFNGQRTAENAELYYQVMPESEVLASPIREEPLYRNPEFPWKIVGGAAILLWLLIFGYFGLRRYRDRNRVIVSGKGVRYGRQTLDFDATSREVLELLLRNPDGVYSQQILDLVEKPDLNPAHNIKVKNQLIDNLNFRLKSLLGLEENLIESYRSPQDKRIKLYRIKPAYFRLR